MQRLVHIRLRHGNVIFEPARDGGIHLMDHAERGITVFHRINDDAYREQIVHLIQRLVLVHHFLIYTEEMLHTSVNFCLDVGILHMLRHFRDDLLDELFPLRLTLVQVFHELIVNIRLPVFQRQIVEFCLDLGNTEPLRDRRINIHRLPGFLLLFRRSHKLQRAHIVKPVRKFDNDHSNILCHGKKHLAQILSLYFKLIL